MVHTIKCEVLLPTDKTKVYLWQTVLIKWFCNCWGAPVLLDLEDDVSVDFLEPIYTKKI